MSYFKWMFPSQSAPKVLLDPNKETIFIIALYKTHIIGGKSSKSSMGSLGSETQILYFWNNYSKLALKNYTKDLQHGFPHSVRIYIFQLTKYEHKGVSGSIDSDDRNFSSAGLVE